MIERPGFVYGLTDPRTGEVRYIGRTVKSPYWRMRAHVNRALAGEFGHKAAWIRVLDVGGFRPGLIIIEQDLLMSEVDERERWWVQAGREWGWSLTNATRGGEGSLRWSSDSRLNLSHALQGRVITEEHREKLRLASTGKRHSPEVIAKIVAKNRGRKLSPEHKQAFSQYWVGKHHSEEHRHKVSEAKKGVKPSEETRRKLSEAAKQRPPRTMSEETKKRMSEAAKRRWAHTRGEVV